MRIGSLEFHAQPLDSASMSLSWLQYEIIKHLQIKKELAFTTFTYKNGILKFMPKTYTTLPCG